MTSQEILIGARRVDSGRRFAGVAGLWLLARWDEQEIVFFAGSPVAEAEVLAAFGPGPEKAR